MKNTFLALILCSINPAICYSYIEHDPIEINEAASDNKTDKRARSIIIEPQAWINREEGNLIISYQSLENSQASIIDAHGDIIVEFDIISDGNSHTYDLPNLTSGIYTLTIESNYKYEGVFWAL